MPQAYAGNEFGPPALICMAQAECVTVPQKFGTGLNGIAIPMRRGMKSGGCFHQANQPIHGF